MKKFLLFCLALAIVCASLSCFTAYGDTGPKASVTVDFKDLGDSPCYATLLNSYGNMGPYEVWDGTEAGKRISDGIDRDIWRAFVDYKDADGFFFVQFIQRIDQTNQLSWRYMPPSTFKVLLYFPESRSFSVSGIYERYAFDSGYVIDCAALSKGGSLSLQRDYRYYSREFFGLMARALVTVLIELAVALFFGLMKNGQIKILVITNLITQLLLNMSLFWVDYQRGPAKALAAFFFLEFAVFVFEGILYSFLLPKKSQAPKKRWYYWLYSLTANAASCIFGRLLLDWFPDIF